MKFTPARLQPFVAPIIGLLLALVIVYSGFIHVLVAFFLVGAIPGTLLSISPTIMLIFFVGASCLVIAKAWREKDSYTSKPSLES